MKRVTLRIPDAQSDALEQTAKNNYRSLNSEILRAIEYYLQNAPEAHYAVAQADQVELKGEVKKKTGK